MKYAYIPEKYPEGVSNKEREADVERETFGTPLAPDRHELRYVGDNAAHHHRHLQVRQRKGVVIYRDISSLNKFQTSEPRVTTATNTCHSSDSVASSTFSADVFMVSVVLARASSTVLLSVCKF